MELIYVRLPQWKIYLYTLQQRIRLYKAINSNRYRWNLSRAEILLLRQTQKKYVSREVMRKPKAFGYQALLQNVLIDNITVATKEEIELVQKLLIVNKLKLEELIMEMKDLKKFAKEVGIKDADVKKMDENTLVKEIITKVEPQQEYSKELVAFYNDLPDNFFDEAEATTSNVETAETESNGAYSVDELVEAIGEFTKVAELKDILADEDVATMFEGFDPSAHKLAPKLKKAMIEFLQNPPSEEGNGDNAETIEALLELESEEDLVAAFEELQETHFSEIDVEGIESSDELKLAMLECLGYKAEQPKEETKPMSLLDKIKQKKEAAAGGGKAKLTAKANGDFDWFDPAGDMEAMYAEVEKIKGIAKLKSFAKRQLGLSLKVGTKKDEVLDAIATAMQELAEGGTAESTTEGETELSIELVNDAVKSKDKEALVAMCEQLEIKLNALQKKSIPGMEKKLKEQLGQTETKPETKAKITPKGKQTKLKLGTKKEEKVSEEKSVYQMMEELVLDGKAESAITKAVTPYYKEKGKSILFIKRRVTTMIKIIKIDNDIEEE